MSDHELLQSYARHHAEAAFASLVGRYVNLVYSAASRQVRSPQLAEEVTQSVFIELARRAPEIPSAQPLAAWLYVVTRRTAINAARGESRRLARETAAAEIAAMKTPSETWSKVAASVDEAMESLNDAERAAVVLRYFQNLSLREVGAELGISEDTAQKRVSRALDRLRLFFTARGVALTAAGLASDLCACALQSAPAGLGATISHVATASVTTAVAVETSRVIAMTTLQKSLVVAACAAFGGLGFYQATLVARQSDEIATFVAQNQRATATLREQRLAHAAAQAKRDDVERRIDGRMADATSAAPGDAALEAQMLEWLAQVDRVKSFLGGHPEWNIPELKLLPANYWLESASLDRLETDEQFRRATARLRDAAVSRAAAKIMVALGAYVRAHGGMLPNDASELAPHFDPPIDPAILARYEVLHPGEPAAATRPQPGHLIAPRPADVEYDANYYIGLTSYGNNGVAMSENVQEARRQFAKVNPGQRGNAEQLLPYLKWPVSQAALEKYLQPRSP